MRGWREGDEDVDEDVDEDEDEDGEGPAQMSRAERHGLERGRASRKALRDALTTRRATVLIVHVPIEKKLAGG